MCATRSVNSFTRIPGVHDLVIRDNRCTMHRGTEFDDLRAADTGEKMIINPGSVGLPAYEDPSPPAHVSESGSPAANYAVLQLSGDQASVEHIAIPYDHAAAARRAEENQSPAWAHFLSTGFARNLANLA
jgi:diadenosine tetraphosphatase ApaH/serine/threonine PP2A family protein phosphatase